MHNKTLKVTNMSNKSSKKRNFRKKTIFSEDREEKSFYKPKIAVDEDSDDVRQDFQFPKYFVTRSETLEELIELRKYRRRPQGIDAEKLSKGEAKAKKKRKEEDPRKSIAGGLTDVDSVGEEERDSGEDVVEKKIMLDSFTKQTNTLDVDKHMMAYIEEEMRKRRGQPANSKNDVDDAEPAGPSDPQDELFQAPEHLRIESKPISEGNVQLSTTMLTAIPEVDLGIDVRLKNIEETEKAKRKLLEQRHNKPKEEKDTFEGSNFSATNRFYRTRPTVSDHERANPDQQNPNPHHNKPGARREMATDDIVAERFKKRLRR
ncbi:11378_t:CDS:2 [Acaulospora colombiana]|uniref:11378_t:CDS:1 n=1 Tax=Acaulospora colombiana TaxID=27376 RepID=A0ACA9K8B5_9GLOM|nr:11378_t:CDS:2 [Acaulospora colombiana]